MPDLIKLLIGPAALSLTNHKAQYTADTLTLQLFVLNYLLFISPFSLAESLLFGSCAFVTSPQSVEGRYMVHDACFATVNIRFYCTLKVMLRGAYLAMVCTYLHTTVTEQLNASWHNIIGGKFVCPWGSSKV